MYDSTLDTLHHIRKVQDYLARCALMLIERGIEHDQSKLLPPEKEAFDAYTPRLATMAYGSEEYRQCLREMKPAIEHHQAVNSHHPEHYADGINGMSLFDLLEMCMDWKAASERHESGGDIARSVEVNKERFGMTDQLAGILSNTFAEMGWL